MSYIEILMIICRLLTNDGVAPSKVDEAPMISHLLEVAVAISEAPSQYQRDLISLGYRESRFGYQFVRKGKPIESSGDCGVFQQRPKWAEGGATTCEKLQDPKEAVAQAVAMLKIVKRRWGKQRLYMCHYNSGGDCDDNRNGRKDDFAYTYARRHLKTLEDIEEIFQELKG